MFADKRLERMRFRSWHRGTREMDLLLGSFADQNLGQLSLADLDIYEGLLLESDPNLYNWITGVEAVPTLHDHALMQQLRNHRLSEPKAS